MIGAGLILVACLLSGNLAKGSAIDDYVWADDGYYKYDVDESWTAEYPGVKTYLLNMTSQRWLSDDDVTRSIWWHDVIVIVPKSFNPELRNSALLLIEGGKNTDLPPSFETDYFQELCMIAATTGSVTAIVRQVPNQPIVFKTDREQKARIEDGIIAYGWRRFIDRANSPQLLPLLPMTKAAVKAMDAIEDFVSRTTGNKISQFCVGGEAARGWTSWLTAAVDTKRVKCLATMAFDRVNFRDNLLHSYKALGGWSFALKDYFSTGVTQYWAGNDDVSLAAKAILDPHEYRDRITIPKFIVMAASDESSTPDSYNFFGNGWKGVTYLNIIPNAGHRFEAQRERVMLGIRSFYRASMLGTSLPEVTWTIRNTPSDGGVIRFITDTEPYRIKAWFANTVQSGRRDFRRMIFNSTAASGAVEQDVEWYSDDVVNEKAGVYTYTMEEPASGYAAFFIQARFRTTDGSTFECTSATKVLPKSYPFRACRGNACLGRLV